MKSDVYSLSNPRNDNRSLIFRQVRENPISRSDIAKNAGICKSSVTALTNQMINQGLLTEIGSVDTGVGRRPVLLDIVADYGYAIGVSISKSSFVCISDLKSNAVAYADVEADTNANEFSKIAIEGIRELLSRSGIDKNKCIGIGVVTSSGFEDVGTRVKNDLEDAFLLPIRVDTDTDLLCAARSKVQSGACLLITLDEDIHSSLAINGNALKGCNIEHFSIDCNGAPCSCGASGCLGAYVSGRALRQSFGKSSVSDALCDSTTAQYVSDRLSFALQSIKNLIPLTRVVICVKGQESNSLLCRLRERFCDSIEFEYIELSSDTMKSSVCMAIIDDYFEML